MTEQSCIFCSIRDGHIPSEKLHEDDSAFVIRDISPVAPTHLLVIPRKHISVVSELEPEDASLMGHLTAIANKMAEGAGIAESGYRLVVNNGPESGMGVSHLHMHVLGGHAMGPVA